MELHFDSYPFPHAVSSACACLYKVQEAGIKQQWIYSGSGETQYDTVRSKMVLLVLVVTYIHGFRICCVTCIKVCSLVHKILKLK